MKYLMVFVSILLTTACSEDSRVQTQSIQQNDNSTYHQASNGFRVTESMILGAKRDERRKEDMCKMMDGSAYSYDADFSADVAEIKSSCPSYITVDIYAENKVKIGYKFTQSEYDEWANTYGKCFGEDAVTDDSCTPFKGAAVKLTIPIIRFN